MSKSLFVEEMAGDLPMAGREITAETPEEAVARVISDAVVTEDCKASADEKWVRVTDSERSVIHRFKFRLTGSISLLSKRSRLTDDDLANADT